jgi:hypothetical protein
MTPRKSKVRTVIDNYVLGRSTKSVALGSGLVFMMPTGGGPEAGTYYLQAKVTPPKGKAFWVCTCRGFRFNPKDSCRHIEFLSAKVDEALDELIEKQDEPRKEITQAIAAGRKARKKAPKKVSKKR